MEKNWYSYAVTDVGKKRSVNQDAIYVNDQQGVWAVADGMGGHRDGDKASQAIALALSKIEYSDVLSTRLGQIEQAIRSLNTELQNYSANELNGQHIGSTLVLITVCQGLCAILWAGDSRCYRGNNSGFEQLSWDHSYVDELLRSGHMAPEEAATSKLSNVITRAVGAHEELFFDHKIFPYSDEDTFVLCSDGLTNELTDPAIYEVLNTKGCSQVALDLLLSKTLDHGAKDNVSIILISSNNRRPVNTHDMRLMSQHTDLVNKIASDLADEEIGLEKYYPAIAIEINKAVTAYAESKGITEPTHLSNSTVPHHQMPTANYPSIDGIENNRFDFTYVLLILAVLSLVMVLLYFVLN